MVTYLLRSYKRVIVLSFLVHGRLIFVAHITGHNENYQFHFVGTTVITVRQHPVPESRKPRGYISGGEHTV
jgi:hypothetical protein